MTFQEVLAQVIDWLQREQRLSYRALKRQFDLDDDYIEDLKEELIYSKRLAVDEDERVLVWIGDIDGIPATASSPAPVSAPPLIQQDQPAQAEPPIPDAERRQLTVMFCDLADSTRLSGQLDPEDLRDVIRAYQATSAEVIERYGGYIAQHLGDGLMVYFGWPQAHEDDAQRAVHAGLGVLEAMQGLNARLQQEKGIRLAVRIGIHTGLVVVGEIGQGASQEHLALGETPNIASRIEGIAEPGTIAISDATYRLVQGYFDCVDLGLHTLKGVDDAQQAYRVVRESNVQSRFDVAATRKLTPLVGRESETTLLFDRWQQAKEGQGQVMLLNGEAGIGKSRLLQVLRDHVADEPHTRLEGRSSPYYQNTALYPLTDMLQRMLQWQQDDTLEQRLAKLEQELSQYCLPLEEFVPLFAAFLSLPIPEDRYPPLNMSPQRQRQKTLESIVAILLEQAEQRPVLFVMEDLHWLDPTSLELLDLLLEQTPTTPILILLTCRPTFQPTWSSRFYLTQMTLNRLSRQQIERMVERVSGGKHLPLEVLQQIVEKTDGVPLFVEEMTKAVLESGPLKETDGQYQLVGPITSLTIPNTLQDSLMARLDRLVSAKGTAQLGATIGRQFSYALLHAVSQLDGDTLQRELRRLIEAELLYQRGLLPQATYTFKHALIQDAAYQSLLKSTRQQYHQRIVQVLTDAFPEIAENQPELLAHHYTEAGLNEQAMTYWQKAGQRAIQRSANVEAVNHFTRGLTSLTALPETPEHVEQEIGLQTALGQALMAAKGQGVPEVEHAFSRAWALCRQVGESPHLFSVIWGLWRFYYIVAKLPTALELGEQCLSLAQRAQDPVLLLPSHLALGSTFHVLGEFASARAHLEQGIAIYDAQPQLDSAFRYGIDLKIWCLSYVAWPLWLLGDREQALHTSREALALARELDHPLSLVVALDYAAWLYQLCHMPAATQEHAEAAIALAREHGFPQYEALGLLFRGWALAEQGQRAEGVAVLRRGMDAQLAAGAIIIRPYSFAMLAEADKKTPEAGLAALSESLRIANATDERWWDAETHRLQGELLLRQTVPDRRQAETCFQQALDIARRQQAKSLELRAAMSLARLWQSQGKRQAAYDLLEPVYGWFTEGFDTADLKDAKALLRELAQ